VNYIEGVGFLAVPYALKEGGIVALLAFIIIPIILWYVGKILTECLYDEDEKGKKRRVRSGFKDLGDALLPKHGGYIAFLCHTDGSIFVICFLPCTLRICHAKHSSVCTHHRVLVDSRACV